MTNTTDPEYAARKWLSDRLADEASTVIDMLDELDQLREVARTLARSISPDHPAAPPGYTLAPVDLVDRLRRQVARSLRKEDSCTCGREGVAHWRGTGHCIYPRHVVGDGRYPPWLDPDYDDAL